MKIALAMIVKGDDREARYLDRALKNMSPFVDGIFITRTHKKGETPNRKVWQVARKYNAVVSDYEWTYDFAAARNFNFKQVPKTFDYIMWSDADDMWRGLEKLRAVIKKNSTIDAFGFWYLYDWDEYKRPTVVHKKTMVVKNDDSVEWVGALHEEFEATRELETHLVEGIDRLHLSDDEERREIAARRNLEIAQRAAEQAPNDPRSYWNLGNALYGVGDHQNAIEVYTKFLRTSESDEEKYIAHTRLSDVYKSVNRNEDAIQELHMAIGLRPYIPDAYLLLAYLYYGLHNFDKAEEYCLQGMVKRPQVHKMIVFNPRDYDYNPMMLLAQVYYEKNRPDKMLPLLKGCLKIYPEDEKIKKMVKVGESEKRKLARALYKVRDLQKIRSKEKLRIALGKLPADLQSHPAICVLRNENFQKTETSSKDMVIYCGQTSHEWHPGKGFIGGSEEAVINLSREFAKMGWNVTVYNNCGHKEIQDDYFLGVLPIAHNDAKPVTYKPFWMWNYRDKQDVVVLWRWCKPLDADINASKIFVDLHDVIPPGELTEKRLAKVTKVMVKSEFHRSLFPNVPDHKIAAVPNGIDFSLLNNAVTKERNLAINTSSPDRSMDVLPALWREVKKRVPKAKLKWAYGWEIFDRTYGGDQKKMDWKKQIQREMKEAGIEELGRLSQEGIGKLYQQASVLAYPTEFAEIDCISVRKAQAAHCLPVTTDFGALSESVEFGYKIHSSKTKSTWNKPYQFHFGLEDKAAQQEWIEKVVLCLTQEPMANAYEWSGSNDFIRKSEWSEIAKRWAALL